MTATPSVRAGTRLALRPVTPALQAIRARAQARAADAEAAIPPCVRTAPGVMFPDRSLPADDPAVEEAKAVCLSGCFRFDACREEALRRRPEEGVWAALTPKEIQAIVRAQSRARARAAKPTLAPPAATSGAAVGEQLELDLGWTA